MVEPGDFSVRGGIVDVFSYSNDLPYRIEFFGDEIESIRSFDIETQISNNNFKKIEILGDIENKEIDYKRENIFDFISDDTIIISENINLLEESLSNSYKKLKQTNQNNVENIFYSGDSIHLDIKKFKVMHYDLYRIKSSKELDQLGLFEENIKSIKIIEVNLRWVK